MQFLSFLTCVVIRMLPLSIFAVEHCLTRLWRAVEGMAVSLVKLVLGFAILVGRDDKLFEIFIVLGVVVCSIEKSLFCL